MLLAAFSAAFACNQPTQHSQPVCVCVCRPDVKLLLRLEGRERAHRVLLLCLYSLLVGWWCLCRLLVLWVHICVVFAIRRSCCWACFRERTRTARRSKFCASHKERRGRRYSLRGSEHRRQQARTSRSQEVKPSKFEYSCRCCPCWLFVHTTHHVCLLHSADEALGGALPAGQTPCT